MKPLIRICLVLFLWPIYCFGQFAGIQQPMFAGAVALQTPEQLAMSGVMYRWVASDLPTNTSITAWPDRIQSFNFYPWPGAVPTNSLGQGVWIDSAHFLTNSWSAINSNMALALIFRYAGNAGAVFPGLIWTGTEGSEALGWMLSYPNYRLSYWSGVGVYDMSANNWPTGTYDLIWDQWATNELIGAFRTWTNGVSANTPATNSSGYFYGGTAVSPKAPRIIGYNFTRGEAPFMFVKEIWVWTNNTPQSYMSEIIRTNFHNYATNTYGFSP